MRIAAIADAHGNLAALEAVLRDAESRGVDSRIFLGDYVGEFPFPNEIISSIRAIGGEALLGNKERFILGLRGRREGETADEQFAPLYWNYRELARENVDFIERMPASLDREIEGVRLRANHHSSALFSGTSLMRMGSKAYANEMRERPFTHSEYLESLADMARRDPAFAERVDTLGGGLLVFGHSHVQWHLRSGGALLVNPGSCGLPLDFDARASYSIIELSGGEAGVEEIRVPYDVGAAEGSLRASPLYAASPLWAELAIRHLADARERFSVFLDYIEGRAASLSRPNRPYDNDIWREAGREWLEGNG